MFVSNSSLITFMYIPFILLALTIYGFTWKNKTLSNHVNAKKKYVHIRKHNNVETSNCNLITKMKKKRRIENTPLCLLDEGKT